jgi:hypothetical protein
MYSGCARTCSVQCMCGYNMYSGCAPAVFSACVGTICTVGMHLQCSVHVWVQYVQWVCTCKCSVHAYVWVQ